MLRNVKIASLATLWLVPLFVLVSALFSPSGWVSSWRAAGVPAILPQFADITTIAEGVDSLGHGRDPLITNLTDPLHRTVSYPRVWLQMFSSLGITAKRVRGVAILFCAFYLACMSVLIAQAKYAGDALIFLVASLSISPLLARELGRTRFAKRFSAGARAIPAAQSLQNP